LQTPEIVPDGLTRVPRVPRSGRGAGQGRGTTPRKWSEEETALFEEGLRLFGRDWQQLSQHIGPTRSLASVKSHTQKHFIWLAKNGLPVPEKVAETGPGHTMDGKPLDLRSRTAMDYLSNDDLDSKQNVLNAMYRQHALDVQAGRTNRPASRANQRRGTPDFASEFPDADDDDDDDDDIEEDK
jgi:SHAQKYF class myb-like DNA-binding protein